MRTQPSQAPVWSMPVHPIDTTARSAVEGAPQAGNDNHPVADGWIALGGYVDPPVPPAGHTVEVKRDSFLGTVTHYRFVERLGDWMQTFTGRQFWPMDPRADEIDIRDIAHSLAMQCRYAGHCLRFYSVAEHSVLIARWLKQAGYSAEIQLAGLMHDAPETYLVDVPRPIKPFLGGYKEAEQRVWEAVAERFGMGEIPGAVLRADSRILGDERAQNMTPTNDDWGLGEPLGVTLGCWVPDRAEREFLAVFEELYGED